MPTKPSDLAAGQRRYWQDIYTARPTMYGSRPSDPALFAAGIFAANGARDLLELGAGHGRDALFFADKGFSVVAADFSTVGLKQLQQAAAARRLSGNITTLLQDAREPIRLPDSSIDAVFAHMLLCMALSTAEVSRLVGEVRRILRPGGTFVYTVRHTGDPHYGAGNAHGDDIFEHGGFAVHFFPRRLVEELAAGWKLSEVHPFKEGELPRRLWRVTQTVPV